MSPGYGHNERDDCGHAADFQRAATASADSINALTRSLVAFDETTNVTTQAFDDLKKQLDALKKPEKGGLSERQIQKTMRLRGKR